ncbi:MAG TPA: YceI family protein [Casimicrobiaceae bacterium]|jgi:polyisoprenoid-binding protein YceI|nr:YceI family protein [Casimicrobiaceae bacterium]
MRLRLIIAAVACALAGPAFGQESYRIDPLHTATTFSVSHLGISMQRGSFGRTTGTVMLDRAAGKGSVDVSIDASTVNSGSPPRETLLKGEDYFNVAQFPTITFKSTRLRFDGDAIVSCDGELTMRGVTRPVVLSVTSFKCAIHPSTKTPVCGAEITASVKRSEFGMVKNAASTGDDVNIVIAVEAIRQQQQDVK